MCSRWSLLGLLLVLLLLSSSQPVEANVRLCGQRLTRTLFQLCRNQLCGSSSFAPSKSECPPGRRPSVSGSSLPALPFPEVHRTMKRSGIATQCCMNKCSYAYLKTYCCID